MDLGSDLVTYGFYLIVLALLIRNGESVNQIIKSLNTFATTVAGTARGSV